MTATHLFGIDDDDVDVCGVVVWLVYNLCERLHDGR
jgi:hypothetical protein